MLQRIKEEEKILLERLKDETIQFVKNTFFPESKITKEELDKIVLPKRKIKTRFKNPLIPFKPDFTTKMKKVLPERKQVVQKIKKIFNKKRFAVIVNSGKEGVVKYARKLNFLTKKHKRNKNLRRPKAFGLFKDSKKEFKAKVFDEFHVNIPEKKMQKEIRFYIDMISQDEKTCFDSLFLADDKHFHHIKTIYEKYLEEIERCKDKDFPAVIVVDDPGLLNDYDHIDMIVKHEEDSNKKMPPRFYGKRVKYYVKSKVSKKVHALKGSFKREKHEDVNTVLKMEKKNYSLDQWKEYVKARMGENSKSERLDMINEYLKITDEQLKGFFMKEQDQERNFDFFYGVKCLEDKGSMKTRKLIESKIFVNYFNRRFSHYTDLA